jgi:hypothetical protein
MNVFIPVMVLMEMLKVLTLKIIPIQSKSEKV